MSPMLTCWLANMWQVMWHESIRFSFLLKFVLIDAMKYVASHCVQMQRMASVYISVNQDSGLNSSTGLIDLPGEPSWGMKASHQVTWPGKPSSDWFAVFHYSAATVNCEQWTKQACTERNGVGSESISSVWEKSGHKIGWRCHWCRRCHEDDRWRPCWQGNSGV